MGIWEYGNMGIHSQNLWGTDTGTYGEGNGELYQSSP